MNKHANEENKILFKFLTETKEGREMFLSSKNSIKLEKKIIKYHNKKGLPNWYFDDNQNEGISWACFDDLFITLKNHYLIEKLIKSYK
jgi:hypothetical protein